VELLVGLLIAVGVWFVLPISAWVSARRTRRRIDDLEYLVDRQSDEIRALTARLQRLGRAGVTESQTAVSSPPSAASEAGPLTAAGRPAAETPGAPLARPGPGQRPGPPTELGPRVTPPPAPPVDAPATPASAPPVLAATPPAPPVTRGSAAPPRQAVEPGPVPASPRLSGAPSPPPPPPQSPRPRVAAFDWENLIGVKLFSGIAGVALVMAAIFFLRYSIEHGWLQPPVRVVIGVAVAVALLAVCELKAARRFPATANALDAAAIAILFATFYAAHALWQLVPAVATFVLLALVTAVAVLLSIRRGSIFIAVLGLLGGFATPALLSTGENRPIPLFAYLMLLNIGLAWVAYHQTWPVLTWLTLILTTLYQWGWVIQFLHASSLSLAMGVFLIFPIAAVVGLLLARPRGAAAADRSFAHTAALSAALPLLFAIYLAAVPAYGINASLLFGFLLLLDAGLLVIALMRGQALLHGAGAGATLLVMAVWLGISYASSARLVVLGFTAAFVVLYLSAPAIAARLGRRFDHSAAQARFAAPLLMFVFPVLARIEPAFRTPEALFGVLMGLLLLISWRALVTSDGGLYYIASFFAVAAQASWSVTHLTGETLGIGVLVYGAFGGVAIATPLVARGYGRTLQPAWGGGAVLLVSLGLLVFLSLGPVRPAALWAMALLLAIMNGGLFVESAAGGLPLLSQAGSIFSWLILAIWWIRAAGIIGTVPSLTVLTGLTLVTLAGHAWAYTRRAGADSAGRRAAFGQGLYLSLVGHLFLTLLALNREWSIPPWPLFGALAVVTLATSASSLLTRSASLHAAGTVAAAVVVFAWAGVVGAPPWGLIAVLASTAVSVYALAWIVVLRREEDAGRTLAAAAVCLFIGDVAVTAAHAGAGAGFPAVAIAHCANITAILWLAWRARWQHLAAAAVVPAWLGLVLWPDLAGPDNGRLPTLVMANAWPELLALAAALYAIFIVYPFVLGARARGERDPYLAAVLASAMFFFSARHAFIAGGLDRVIGIVPIATAGGLALLVRELLRLEPAGERDTGRLALVAGASLAFVTVAIPLQLRQQWITIGWALEGAALAWLYRRIRHRGLLYFGDALLAAVFARLAMNPEVLLYEPRGALRIFNWYLYTYMICAIAFLIAAWWLSPADDRIIGTARSSQILSAAGVVLLFLLLNIEIADFYATGPTIAFRFGAAVSQDLTYTIGWLAFGLILLGAGILIRSRAARMAAVLLIAVTTLKCFLYDLGSLEGLYKVASLTGLALSLVIVAIVLQRFVLSKPEETA
jgi:uncharacterized membrane protein